MLKLFILIKNYIVLDQDDRYYNYEKKPDERRFELFFKVNDGIRFKKKNLKTREYTRLQSKLYTGELIVRLKFVFIDIKNSKF